MGIQFKALTGHLQSVYNCENGLLSSCNSEIFKYLFYKFHCIISLFDRYSSCGYKRVTTSAQNEITDRIYSETDLEIFVACPISSKDIFITTYPTIPTPGDNSHHLTVPIFRNLSLDIHLASGSFPVFNISWGDDTFDVIDFYSNAKFPRDNLSLAHQFNQLLIQAKQRQLRISVCNQFSCGERSIAIKVTKCGPPLLEIDHDAETMLLPRDQENEIFLKWKNHFPECAYVDWNEYFFEYHVSELSIGTENYLDEIQSKIEQDFCQVILTIPKFTLQVEGEKIQINNT